MAIHRTCFAPKEFVSGGQVGADSIPFSVYEELGIGLRGFMPLGFKRSDGRGAEIAVRYGLTEGEGGDKWRDMRNVESADACLAFLTTLPMTGRGTMQTVNMFVAGQYKHVQLDKPEDSNFLVIKPSGTEDLSTIENYSRSSRQSKAKAQQLEPRGGKPVIIFWDIAESKLNEFAVALETFLKEHRPRSLMISGPMERTWPGIEMLGASLLKCALLSKHSTCDRDSSSCAVKFEDAEKDLCPVCEGTGRLLKDPCPLCEN